MRAVMVVGAPGQVSLHQIWLRGRTCFWSVTGGSVVSKVWCSIEQHVTSCDLETFVAVDLSVLHMDRNLEMFLLPAGTWCEFKFRDVMVNMIKVARTLHKCLLWRHKLQIFGVGATCQARRSPEKFMLSFAIKILIPRILCTMQPLCFEDYYLFFYLFLEQRGGLEILHLSVHDNFKNNQCTVLTSSQLCVCISV